MCHVVYGEHEGLVLQRFEEVGVVVCGVEEVEVSLSYRFDGRFAVDVAEPSAHYLVRAHGYWRMSLDVAVAYVLVHGKPDGYLWCGVARMAGYFAEVARDASEALCVKSLVVV